MTNYIDNKKFEHLVTQYCAGDKTVEDDLMLMIDALITNIIRSYQFKLDEDDAKQSCFLLILRILQKFDPSRGKVFNFFTTAILNNLRHMYMKNETYALKLERYFSSKEHIKELLEP